MATLFYFFWMMKCRVYMDVSRIKRIIDKIDRMEKNNIEIFRASNPYFVLMGSSHALMFLPKGRGELRARLAVLLHEEHIRRTFYNRGLAGTADLKRHNGLVCAVAKKTKRVRRDVRRLSISQLEKIMIS